MNDFTQLNFASQVLAFVSLFFCLLVLIFWLNALWRAHKMLATFIRLCIVAVAILALRKIIGVLGLSLIPQAAFTGQCFDVLQSLFFAIAAVEFFRIIRLLDGEAPAAGENAKFKKNPAK